LKHPSSVVLRGVSLYKENFAMYVPSGTALVMVDKNGFTLAVSVQISSVEVMKKIEEDLNATLNKIMSEHYPDIIREMVYENGE
jgi:hypothetical protein